MIWADVVARLSWFMLRSYSARVNAVAGDL